MRSTGGPDFADDGGLSSSDSEDDEEDDEDETFVDALDIEPIPLSSSPRTEEGLKSPDTPTPASVVPTPRVATTPQLAPPTPKSSTGFIPKMKFPRKLSSRSNTSSTTASTSSSSTAATPGISPLPTPASETAAPLGEKKSRKASGAKKTKSKAGYQFEGGNDIVGIVMLEIQSAEDLPRLKNSAYPLLRFPTLPSLFFRSLNRTVILPTLLQ